MCHRSCRVAEHRADPEPLAVDGTRGGFCRRPTAQHVFQHIHGNGVDRAVFSSRDDDRHLVADPPFWWRRRCGGSVIAPIQSRAITAPAA